jgi:hypothetical protein
VSISINAGMTPAQVLAKVLADLIALLGKDVTKDQLSAVLNEALGEL